MGSSEGHGASRSGLFYIHFINFENIASCPLHPEPHHEIAIAFLVTGRLLSWRNFTLIFQSFPLSWSLRMLCKILSLWGNQKFGGGIQNLHVVSIPCFLMRVTLAGGLGGGGCGSPRGQKNFEIFYNFFKEKINFDEKCCKTIKKFSFILGQFPDSMKSNRIFYDFQKSFVKTC